MGTSRIKYWPAKKEGSRFLARKEYKKTEGESCFFSTSFVVNDCTPYYIENQLDFQRHRGYSDLCIMIHITKDNFSQEVLGAKGSVLVDFFAEWCGPCKIVSPILDEISKEYPTVKFVKVNVDDSPDLATQYSVFSIPTFIFFIDGKPVHQLSGALGKEQFREQIRTVFNLPSQ